MPRVRHLLMLAVAAVLLLAPAARSASADMVISQVFAGGGNANAPYTNDFVELFNRGSTSVDLASWSLQYASGAGTTWQVTPLSGSVPPGGRYLVQRSRDGLHCRRARPPRSPSRRPCRGMTETLPPVRLKLSRARTGRRLAALIAAGRDMRPHTQGILDFRLRRRVRGATIAHVVIPAVPGRNPIRRTDRIRL